MLPKRLNKNHLIVSIAVICAIIISTLALKYEWITVLHNIYYIPIVLSCFYFRKKGLFFSFGLIALYFLILLQFQNLEYQIQPTIIRITFFSFTAIIVTIIADQLHRAESLLREKMELWNFAIEANEDAVWDWDMRSGVIHLSNRFKELFGYDEKYFDVKNNDWRIFIHPEDVEQCEKNIAEYLKGKQEIYWNERRVLCKDGSYKWVLDRGKIIERDEDGNPLRMIGTHSDISKRKNIEIQNQQTTKQLQDERNLFLNGPVVVFKWKNEPSYPVEYVSKNVQNILGYTDEEIINQKIRFRNLIHPDDLKAVMEEIRKYETESYIYFEHHPYRMINKNGKIVWINDYTTVIKNEKNEITHFIGYIIDVTQKIEFEAALKESNERYRILVENISDLIFKTNEKDEIVFVSNSIYEFLGISYDDIIGQSRIPNIYEDDVAATLQSMNVAKQPPYESYFEHRILTGDGWRWIAWKLKSQFSSDNIYSGIVGIGRDITYLKELEIILKEGEEKFRNIIESAPFPLIIRKLEDGIILYANRKAELFLEFKREEVLNKRSIYEFHYKSDIRNEINSVLKKQGYFHDYEMQFLTNRGKVIWIIASFNLFEYNELQAVAASYLDISDRKRFEAALRESEERYRILAENASDMISKHDLLGKYLYVTPNCLELTGYTKEELVGTNAYNYFFEPDIDAIQKSHNSIVNEPKVKSVRYRFKKKGGSLVWVETTSKTIINPETDSVTEIVAITRDVTERVLAEEKQLNIERKLLQSQKFESLGVMAAGIAHDYNTFLLGIMGNLELSLAFMNQESKPASYIQKSLNASKRAANLTKQILTYLGHGKFDFKIQSVNEIITSNLEIINTLIENRAELLLNLKKDLPDIRCDAVLLSQALANMITNSIEAMEAPKGTIKISTGVDYLSKEDLMSNRLSEKPRAGNFVFIKVEDNGQGMESSTIQKVFDPFFTTKKTGRGLGAPAILGIARIHNGAIFLDSEVKKGTIITIYIPVTAARSIRV